MGYDVNVVLTVMADEVARLTLENAILKAKLDALDQLSRDQQNDLQELQEQRTTEADTAASYDLTNPGGSTP